MALELKISEDSYIKDTHIATFNDDTGVYNVATNIGGYGAPNPDRAGLALVVSTVRVSGQMEVVKWSDPISDTSFDYDFFSDGVHDVYLCSIPFEAGAYDVTLMSEGFVFYSVLDDKIYKVVDKEGIKSVEETNDVVSNSLDVSLALKYKVQSHAETKRINIFCEDVKSCDEKLTETYKDVLKSIDAAECYFEEGFYLQSDKTLSYLCNISK